MVTERAVAEAQEAEEEDFVDELKPGTRLLHKQYVIESYLNSGGFGVTYLARDSLNRQVVIKECFPSSFCYRRDMSVQPRSRAHQAQLRGIVRLFAREAVSLAKVEHPNIVRVHNVFEDNNTAYMAMDYVKGLDLLEVIGDESIKLTSQQIEDYLTKLLSAIGHVHKNGLLHRDISPDNILINDKGEPILIDFGAAREQAGEVNNALSALRVVKDGYSPQEFYIAGSEQSASCDLYSLAASFYHIITGELPPDSQTRLSALAADEADPYVPLSRRSAGYNRAFTNALDKAISVLPKDRIQTADEWLELIKPGRVVKAKPKQGAARKATMTGGRGASFLFGTALAVIAGAAFYVSNTEGSAELVENPVAGTFAAFSEAPALVASEPAQAETQILIPLPEKAFLIPDSSSPSALDVALPETSFAAISETVWAVPDLEPPTKVEVAAPVLAPFEFTPEPVLSAPVIASPVASKTTIAEPLSAAPLTDTPAIAAALESSDLRREVGLADIANVAPVTVLYGRSFELPFEIDPKAPGVIGAVHQDAPSGIEVGQHVTSINGFGITNLTEISTFINPEEDFAATGAANLLLGLSDAAGEAVANVEVSVPVIYNIALTNGLRFQSAFEDGAWVTRVVQTTATYPNVQSGDVVVAELGTNTRIDGPLTLQRLIETGFGNDVSTFGFALERAGTTRIETLDLRGS